MSKKKKPKEEKPTLQDLHKRVEDVKKLSDEYKSLFEDKMKSRPLESATMIFLIGMVLGILIGSSIAKRS